MNFRILMEIERDRHCLEIEGSLALVRSYRLAFVPRRLALPRTGKYPIIIHAIGKEDLSDTAVRRNSFEIDKALGRCIRRNNGDFSAPLSWTIYLSWTQLEVAHGTPTRLTREVAQR